MLRQQGTPHGAPSSCCLATAESPRALANTAQFMTIIRWQIWPKHLQLLHISHITSEALPLPRRARPPARHAHALQDARPPLLPCPTLGLATAGSQSVASCRSLLAAPCLHVDPHQRLLPPPCFSCCPAPPCPPPRPPRLDRIASSSDRRATTRAFSACRVGQW